MSGDAHITWSLLADLTLLAHTAFVLFIVAGQVLILVGWRRHWRWPANAVFRVLHLVAIGFVVLESWFGVTCPLTWLEDRLRQMAGESVYEMSFIAHWTHYFLFYTAPDWVFTLVYSLFAILVLATFRFYPPRWRSGMD